MSKSEYSYINSKVDDLRESYRKRNDRVERKLSRIRSRLQALELIVRDLIDDEQETEGSDNTSDSVPSTDSIQLPLIVLDLDLKAQGNDAEDAGS